MGSAHATFILDDTEIELPNESFELELGATSSHTPPQAVPAPPGDTAPRPT